MLIKRLFLIFLTALLLFAVTAIPSAEEENNHHSKTPYHILNSASELDYPPFSIIRPDGTPDGFSIDILKAVVHEVGLDVNFAVGPWTKIKQKLIDKEIDVLPLVSYSKDRDKVFDFTAPYLRMHGTIFVRQGETSIHSESDLKDKEVVVMRGDTAHEYAVTHNLSNKLILTDTFEEAMRLLSSGSHDAVVIQKLVGLQLIKKLNISNLVSIDSFHESNFKPVSIVLSGFEQKFCIAVQEGDKDLLSLMNEGLAIVFANGTYEDIYDKWLGPILPQPLSDPVTIIKKMLFIMVPLLLFLSGLGLLYLKREVANKTASLVQEVKDRKLIENELRASEKFLESVIDHSPFAMWISDDNGIVIKVNKSLLESLNLRAEQILGKYNVLNDENISAQGFGDQVIAVFEKHKSARFIMNWAGRLAGPVDFKGGRDNLTIDVSMFPIINNDGILLNVVCQWVDITERRQAEDALRESEEKYRSIFENAIEGFFQSTPQGRFISVNPSFAKMLGYESPEEIISSISDIATQYYVNNEDRNRYKQLLEKYGYVECFEFKARCKGGSHIWVSNSTRAIYDKDGNIIRYEGNIADITARKQAEEEKNRLETQLQQARKMESIGTLAGGIAHDFNNILSPILGYTEMMLDDNPGDSPFRDNLKEIYTSALRARDLVKQILTFSRQDTDELKLVNVHLIIKEALKLIRATIPKTIEMKQDINADCCLIKADPTQVHQIMMNLATNAYHAMEQTGGELKVSLKEIQLGRHDIIISGITPGKYACLTVTDTGDGIQKEIKDKIFDPYFTTKEQGKGTGMGLSVVHGIVNKMNGAIQVYSEPGKGTEFRVYIPIVMSNVTDKDIPAQSEIQGGTERILLVDDEQDVIIMEKQMLERLGYRVSSRTSSIEALEAFWAHPDKYDLVITDMAMPKMSGDKLSYELIKLRPDIPILLCTGFSEIMSEEKAISLGIKGFLMKPIVMNDIAKKIRDVLDKI